MADYQGRAKALDEIINSIRDLYTVKLKLPLGNPNLKLVHTNQFLFTELPTDVFELANMSAISKALNSKYSRYSGYQVNRWYIESVTITNDGSNFYMELELNPFATPLIKYSENNRGFVKAFSDAFEQNNNNNNSNNNNSSGKNNVKSTTTGITLKNVKGFSKKDQKYIKKVVTQALKKKNYPKTEKMIVYALYEHYNKNHVYDKYECMPKMRNHGFEYTWKKQRHNCGDGAATLQAMFKCAGLKADIFNGHYHFWVRVRADGEYYYCDQAGKPGGHNKRAPGKKGNDNNVWGGIKGGSIRTNYC